jgi:Cu/Zn superoxide dismutase
MTKLAVLSGTAAALVLGLTVAGAAVARTQASTIRLSAPLSAAQEVPATTGDVSAARGTFTATVTATATGATIEWQLTFGGLTGAAAAAHIHTGPRGQAGGVSVPLCGPCASPVSGTANVDATVLNALQTGGTYANVHTATNKGGEVRGQIDVVANVSTALTARQEVPKAKGNVKGARATFTATVTTSGATGKMGWRLTFSGLTGRAAAAHIHTGQRGKAGPVVVPLCGPCRSGMRRSVELSPAVLAALQAGRAYVNVHTGRNPAGEVRGQIAAVPLRITG